MKSENFWRLTEAKNGGSITIGGNDGKEYHFEQVAIIKLYKKDYAILRPVVEIFGVKNNKGLVFSIDKKKEQISAVANKNLVASVFEAYLNMHKKLRSGG